MDKIMQAIVSALTHPDLIRMALAVIAGQVFAWTVTRWFKLTLPNAAPFTRNAACRLFAFSVAAAITATIAHNLAYALWITALLALFSGLLSPTSYAAWKDLLKPRITAWLRGKP